MENLFKPTGNTPFEIAEARMARGQAKVKAASALNELIKNVQECDIMIANWREQLIQGDVDPDTRDLATQALREKRICNEAIEKLTELMLAQFQLEA